MIKSTPSKMAKKVEICLKKNHPGHKYSVITRPNYALDRRTILCLCVTGFQKLVLKHVPLTLCGFRLQLRIPQQLNLTINMSYYLFVDSTNCSGLRKYGCGFRKFVYFWCHFERNSVFCICLWNS